MKNLFVLGVVLGICIGAPVPVCLLFKTLTVLARAEKERDAAWKMYRILADDKNVLESGR